MEYLRILAKHRPAAFVFEMSRDWPLKIKDQNIFQNILESLSKPQVLSGANSLQIPSMTKVSYSLYGIGSEKKSGRFSRHRFENLQTYLIKAENMGFLSETQNNYHWN